ncbi:hypothetical protein DRN73_05280 [Candidatus Pacearchaeota archaeon]|nr:MAG: hypothetical protein DRN73_05280 [Candidatus Pacearchaeota archaeon]
MLEIQERIKIKILAERMFDLAEHYSKVQKKPEKISVLRDLAFNLGLFAIYEDLMRIQFSAEKEE